MLGVLLIIACFAYIANLFAQVLAPGLGARIAPVFIVPAGIAELSFLAWLLVKTVKLPGPGDRSPAPVMPPDG